jgi:hypothetical protein
VTGHRDPHLVGIDPSTPNPARIYDALLGGKDNFPADRDAVKAILAMAPQARQGARENRAFLQRAVRYLAAEAGIRQFLDIGTGLPTQGNVHQVAQAAAPDVRVAYVDHDPVVHAHANALLADHTTTIAVLADLREPKAILGHPEVRRVLDFTRPLAVLLVAVLHFLRDDEDPVGIVACLRDAMAPGSYLVISHATADFHPQVAAKITDVYRQASAPLVLRSRSQIARFFEGFGLVAPGLVQPAAWRPNAEGPASPGAGGFYSGVGRRERDRRSSRTLIPGGEMPIRKVVGT